MFKLLLGFLCVVHVAALGKQFTYEVEHYPPVGNCHQVAADLAQKFSAQLGSAARGRCLAIEKSGFHIEVNYEAEEALELHSTFPKWGTIWKYGAYSTEDACNRALPEWIQTFRRETQLEPLVAFCFDEKPQFSDKLDWAVRIDALGTPAKRPIADGFMLGGSPVGYEGDAFVTALRQALTHAGIEIAHARFQYTAAQYELSLVYYTDGPRVSKSKPATFYRREDCHSELEEAKGVMALTKSHPALLICAKTFLSGHELIGFYTGQAPKTWLAAERMDSYDECRNRKSELVRMYQQMGYSTVVGGLCSKSGKDYKLVLVSPFE